MRRSTSDVNESAGLWLGLLAVAAFSLTLPVTRIAVTALDPTVVGAGRALLAAVPAALLLAVMRSPRPTGQQLLSLAWVAGGVVIGFPLLSSFAMRDLPAVHGAVVVALLPLLTTWLAAWRANERPSRGLWAASIVGAFAVLSFAYLSGAGGFEAADGLLLAAAVVCAVGYAEGGRLARSMGGWQVISWALLLAAPFLAWPCADALLRHGLDAPWQSWASLVYLALVSQWLAFFCWYRGLALGGVARVSQVQLLQPFFTIGASVLLFGETASVYTLPFVVLVVLVVAVGRRYADR